jgi:anti-sigma factor RsiW
MTCAEVEPLLGPALDGELDARSALEVEAHVERCASCTRHFDGLQALSQLARTHLPRYELPKSLERRILHPRRRAAWIGSVAAAAAALAVIAFVPRGDRLSDEAIAAHARSLQLSHALDVTTSDQHTVKPWFEGKVGFGVPVRDFAEQGFALEGGRLDQLDGRPAAAIVYRHAKHLVNLFVIDTRASDAPLSHGAERGFNVWRWRSGGLQYLLVSDVNDAELGQFAELLRRE